MGCEGSSDRCGSPAAVPRSSSPPPPWHPPRTRVDVAALPEQCLHVCHQGGGVGAALTLRPAQQVRGSAGAVALGNHVKERHKVAAHGRGELLGKPKVEQNDLHRRRLRRRLPAGRRGGGGGGAAQDVARVQVRVHKVVLQQHFEVGVDAVRHDLCGAGRQEGSSRTGATFNRLTTSAQRSASSTLSPPPPTHAAHCTQPTARCPALPSLACVFWGCGWRMKCATDRPGSQLSTSTEAAQ